jgi:hypothetical protein
LITVLCPIAGTTEIPDIRIATINSLRMAALPLLNARLYSVLES